MALQLLVVTPERKAVETEADEVELPGSEGYLGILPGHTPLITLLKPGVLSFKRAGRSQAFAVSSGFAEIASDRVSIESPSIWVDGTSPRGTGVPEGRSPREDRSDRGARTCRPPGSPRARGTR